ncbi:MAG: ABC transporter ATP-binding protein [Proteobacteria bacterium]|nr:ABC transporter ATP-binding protein [Pseudomonadota bacterium]
MSVDPPTSAASPAVHVAGLEKRFGARVVLAGVDLSVAAGDAFGLLGINGAGKTTLIKCILDLMAQERGRVEIFGVPGAQPHARARLAYLPERFIPPHYLRGGEFIELMLRLSGRTPEAAQIAAMLERIELDSGALRRPVRQLSKGMTQKLGLAACLLVDCDLYILDEPMSDLDPASRIAVKSALQGLGASGKTLFFTSHVLADVEELCQSIAILDRGMTRFRGTPSELRALYAEPTLERAFIRCIRSDADFAAEPA